MRNVVIIPARGGSKRLPDKNIRLLGGVPLVAHSILYAQANPDLVSEIYISTDSAQIADIAQQYGAKVIDRPESLSGDQEPTVTALKHAVQQLGNVNNIILLQPTNPLRPKNLLAAAFEIYRAEKCNSLFTVTRNYHKFGRISDGRFIPFNYSIGQRSQDLEPLYFENGLLYIAGAENIMNNVLISDDAYPMIVDHVYATVDIDTETDFEYAQFLMNL